MRVRERSLLRSKVLLLPRPGYLGVTRQAKSRERPRAHKKRAAGA